MQSYDVIIIGAGPAGISTAIQLKRFGLEPLIIEKDEIGGLLRNANLVENYLGFPNGITGHNLVKLFKDQVKNNKIDIAYESVINVVFCNDLFEITVANPNQETFYSKMLVIASGTTAKTLDLISNRVFYDIVSLGNIKNKTIAVIGAGDAAFDYGLNLSKYNNVLILNKSEKIKCINALFEKCKETQSIKYLSNIKLIELKEHQDGLSLICENGNLNKEIYADYLLVAIGREPNLNFINESLKNKINELIERKILYLIGDVKNKNFRQTSICTGDGIKAAMEIFEKLKSCK